jgi:hypothetical protein
MNHPFVKEQAEGLASRVLGASQTERIPMAHQVCYGRSPSIQEEEKALAYIARYTQELQGEGVPGNRLEIEAWTSYARILLTANEFVFVE